MCKCVSVIVSVSNYVCVHMHTCVHVDGYEDVWGSDWCECPRGLALLCIYPFVLFNLSLFLSLFPYVEPPWEGGGAILGTTPHPTMVLNIFTIFIPIPTLLSS